MLLYRSAGKGAGLPTGSVPKQEGVPRCCPMQADPCQELWGGPRLKKTQEFIFLVEWMFRMVDVR